MLRPFLGVLLVALPLAAAGQIVHDVDGGGLWTIGGTNSAENIIIDCVDGTAKANDTDPASGPRPCIDIVALNLVMGGGDDFAYLRVIDQFAFDPATPSSIGGVSGDGVDGDDIVQFDFRGFTDAVNVGFGAPPTGPPVMEVSNKSGILFDVILNDPTLNAAVELGPGDNNVIVGFGERIDLVEIKIEVYGSTGDDTVDGSGTILRTLARFLGSGGDDTLIAGGLDTELTWRPGDGTDRVVGGDGLNGVRIIGGDDLLGIHQILGFLGTGCALFDFIGGGGVIDEGIDEVFFFPGDGGAELFAEVDCDVDFTGWEGDVGTDRSFLRGGPGDGNRLDLDFEFDTAIFTDGFESGDVSSWSSGVDRHGTPALRGGTLWDGIDYQDWPSFASPATSGPSRVVIRGKPDFPVTIDMGPDGSTGRGGAVDSLLVDPLGLPFTDDGSQIVIDGGPPITYAGAEVVRVGAPTATAGGPDGEGPTLAVFPNPTVGGGRVRLEAPGRTEARVVVLDVLAREVAVLHNGPLTGAREWRLSDRGIAPGVYMVLAHGAGWVVSQRVVVAE